MILKKIITGLFLISILSGCVQSTSLLGPAYTLASSGNVYQASLSYGSGIAIEKVTGKTTAENIKSFVVNEKIKNEEKENYDDFFALVKKRIEKTSKVLNLANQ